MKIAVLAPSDAWHFQDLHRAARDHHQLIACDFRSLAASAGKHGQQQFYAGNVCLNKVDAIIVRIMPQGSLEQIVLRMDILNSLYQDGKRIVNPPKAIETAVDKYLTLARLSEHRIPVPPTFASESQSAAMEAFYRFGGDILVKPLFGSMGQGIKRITEPKLARIYFERKCASGEVCYLQKFVEHGDSDLRLLVIGDRVLGMKRTRAGHWLTNIASGATGSAHQPTPCEIKLAQQATAAVGAEIAGVDVIYDAKTNKPLVLEVNAAPGWLATSKTLQIDVATMLLEQVTMKR